MSQPTGGHWDALEHLAGRDVAISATLRRQTDGSRGSAPEPTTEPAMADPTGSRRNGGVVRDVAAIGRGTDIRSPTTLHAAAPVLVRSFAGSTRTAAHTPAPPAQPPMSSRAGRHHAAANGDALQVVRNGGVRRSTSAPVDDARRASSIGSPAGTPGEARIPGLPILEPSRLRLPDWPRSPAFVPSIGSTISAPRRLTAQRPRPALPAHSTPSTATRPAQ